MNQAPFIRCWWERGTAVTSKNNLAASYKVKHIQYLPRDPAIPLLLVLAQEKGKPMAT